MEKNLLIITVFISLKIALTAALISFVVGTLFARVLANRKSWVALILELVITIPVFMPPTVMGYYLLLLLGRNGLIGNFFSQYLGIDLIFTQFSAVLASSLAALPVFYKTMRCFFESTDVDVLNAAKIDGADRIHILFFIEIPLGYKGILSGLMLAFLRGLGEFGITLMIAGNIPFKTQTISLGIYEKVMAGKTEETHIFALLLCIIAVSLIAAIRFLDSKIKIN